MIHDRIPPRDSDRISDDSCPDCFHLKEECVCEADVHADALSEMESWQQGNPQGEQ